MCRKLAFLVFVVFGLFLMSSVKAADPDLAAYWKFDEGSGTTAYDSSGNGNDGVFNGNPQWVAGKYGGALEFDGDDYVNCGNGDSLQIQDEITITFWFQVEAFSNTWEAFLAKSDTAYRASRSAGTGNATHMGASGSSVGGGNGWFDATVIVTDGQWHHWAGVYDGTEGRIYIDGVLDTASPGTGQINIVSNDLYIGENSGATGRFLHGLMDEVRIYSRALTDDEILEVMAGAGSDFPFASGPTPADGSLHHETWVSMSWRAGDFAVSHDVYLGEDFDDVNDATPDSEPFRGNQPLGTEFFIAGFFGYPYPDGLVNGTTYYWRIDEVNEADPNSPWKGPVWSFTVPPKTAYFPVPADGAEFVDLDAKLTWTPGFGAKLHFVAFGEDFDEVNNATGTLTGSASYSPGPLKLAKTYYWRVDESDGLQTYKGDIWNFTTLGAVSGPNPADGTGDVKPSIILSWDAGAVAESHEVYFGTDADAVKNATKASPEYKGPKELGEETYNPGKLTLNTSYFWRIDEINSVNPDSPWPGNVWSFTTGDYFVIDDFEDYNANDNQIWFSWHDGLGAGAPGMPEYVPGNGTGSAVGDESTPSFTEETIVHGGLQSMPLSYDNNKQGFAKYSETEKTLTDQRDWTEQGVANLSLWFRGYPASVGSFAEGPTGTYTMTGSGADIWNEADEFHFAYKNLTGVGSIVARVQSVDQTDNWAKAGVMIRETLEPGSKHAMTVVTPAQGVSFQRRVETDNTSSNTDETGLVAPYWVKIVRDIAGNFTGSRSADGSTWEIIGTWENIQMGANVYIGLAVTSHNAGLTCQAVFTNVTTTGNVSGQWTSQDIGILSNDAESLYVAVSNSTGTPAIVVHDDPAASTIDTWTELVIPLQTLADQGIDLTNVDRIAIGLGTQGNMTIPGGSGKIFIDDIRLIQPIPEPEPQL